MHIEEKKATEASEVYTVHVPVERFNEHVETFINIKSKTFRKDGFRPGKVPLDVVRVHLMDDARAWADEQIARDSWDEVQKKYNDRKWPGHNSYQLNRDDEKFIKVDITCEVWPDLEIKGKSLPSFERSEIVLSAKTLKDKLIPEMLKSLETFEPAAKDYAAQKGDRVKVLMYFRHKGKEIPNSRVQNESVVLSDEILEQGKNTASVAHLFSQLVGKKAGEVVRNSVKGTKDFHWGQRSLIGEKVECECRVVAVEQKKSQSDLKDLAVHLNVDEKDVESHIQEKFEHFASLVEAMHNKRKIFDHLNEAFPFDVAERRWKEELYNILQSYDMDNVDNDSVDIAKRRVRLGIIIEKLVEKCDKPTDEVIHKGIELYALTQRLDPVMVMMWMRSRGTSQQHMSDRDRNYWNIISGAISEWRVARHVLDQIEPAKKKIDWEKCQKEWVDVLPPHFLEDDFVLGYLLSGQPLGKVIGKAKEAKKADASSEEKPKEKAAKKTKAEAASE